MLGLLGGVAGIALAYWGVSSLSSLLPPSLPRANEIRVDTLVLGFALLLSGLASGAFGLAPALFAANSNLQAGLREGGARSGETGGRRRARSFLAAGEIALAMVLLVAAGLLLRSFAKLMSVSPGFDVQHVLKADISLPRFQYSTPQQWATFSDELLARIQAEPGLRGLGRGRSQAHRRPLRHPGLRHRREVLPSSASASRTAEYVSVSPGYFHVMGIPLAGRTRLRPARRPVLAARLDHQPGHGAALFPESGSPGKAAHLRLSARGCAETSARSSGSWATCGPWPWGRSRGR